MELERTELLGREQEANRLKDEFLAALSHELRTPLNAILGWTQILLTTGEHGAKNARALASIDRNARAQARMIEDLLDVSRIVTGKFHIKNDVVDTGAVVDAALEVIGPAAAAKHLTVGRSVPSEPCLVAGDHDRLQQVMWNLLSNVLKFTASGGRIDVSVTAREGVCTVSVRDTGIGIAPGFLPYVFDRFRQADGTMAREHGGLGLGLAIVRDVVQLHGGSVAAQSDGPGLGATFLVRLPLLATAAQPPGDARDEPVQQLHGLTVLVVDDDEDARDIAAAALSAAGAAVRTADSAQAALVLLDRERFSAVVFDIGLPEMDGYTLLQVVRGRENPGGGVHAVAMTAYASPDDDRRARAHGFQAHVAKPVSTATLVAAVAGVSGNRVAARDGAERPVRSAE